MKIEKLKQIIENSDNIVIMTGAGISVPSGIPDFRSQSGLFKTSYQGLINPEEILSHTFYLKYPDRFYEYYQEKMIYPEARPNQAHFFLARLEAIGKVKTIITQNIDGLHQQAGSINVLELHGSIHRNTCLKCQKKYDLNSLNRLDKPFNCICGGMIKPDVVLYEEPLDQKVLRKAVAYLEQAKTLIVIGTSLLVNPAAALVNYFSGEHFIIINQSTTPYDASANLIIRAPLETVLTEKLLF